MTRKPSNDESEVGVMNSAAQIRSAIEENHEQLLRSVALLVAKSERGLPWSVVMEIALETLQRAVQEALNHVNQFDATRSATAWVRGIAAKLLLTRRREGGRDSRCISATALGDEAWAAALWQISVGPSDAATGRRLDLEQALGRISCDELRVIKLRYYQGLDGEELATVLGVSTAGAARVRLCRALQALRTQFIPAAEEVCP